MLPILLLFAVGAWWTIGCAVFLRPVIGWWPGFLVAQGGASGLFIFWLAMGWI